MESNFEIPSLMLNKPKEDLRQILKSESPLQAKEAAQGLKWQKKHKNRIRQDYIGKPIPSLDDLIGQFKDVDKYGFVKKKILEEGGGKKPHVDSTISLALTGFWEGEDKPFDVYTMRTPLVVEFKENGLLPGLQMALKSMTIGEYSLFLLSHEVMYEDMDIPPRIKPKTDCLYYVKLITSLISPENSFIVTSAGRRPDVGHDEDGEEWSPARARVNAFLDHLEEHATLPYHEFAAELLEPLYFPAPARARARARRHARNRNDNPFDNMINIVFCSLI